LLAVLIGLAQLDPFGLGAQPNAFERYYYMGVLSCLLIHYALDGWLFTVSNLRGANAVQHQAGTHHIEMRDRITDDRGAIGHVTYPWTNRVFVKIGHDFPKFAHLTFRDGRHGKIRIGKMAEQTLHLDAGKCGNFTDPPYRFLRKQTHAPHPRIDLDMNRQPAAAPNALCRKSLGLFHGPDHGNQPIVKKSRNVGRIRPEEDKNRRAQTRLA